MPWHLTFYRDKKAWLDKDGILVDKAVYSGHSEGVNNHSFEATPDIGPIPRGLWIISGPPFDHPKRGPYCLRLTPAKGTDTFNRSGFLVHGDEIGHVGEYLASEGCIIACKQTRQRLYQSGDTQLLIVIEEDKEES